MNPYQPSKCPLCRSSYTHFPKVSPSEALLDASGGSLVSGVLTCKIYFTILSLGLDKGKPSANCVDNFPVASPGV